MSQPNRKRSAEEEGHTRKKRRGAEQSWGQLSQTQETQEVLPQDAALTTEASRSVPAIEAGAKVYDGNWVSLVNSQPAQPEIEAAWQSSNTEYSFKTIISNAYFNVLILLTIDSESDESGVSMNFTSLRPKTAFGFIQGHHVISHRLVLEFCAKVALYSKLVEVPDKLRSAFERIIPDILFFEVADGPQYPQVPDSKMYMRCREELSAFLESKAGVGHRKAYEGGMRQHRINIVSLYLSNMLTYYNGMPDVVNEREGDGGRESGGANQGKESNAIIALNAISHFLTLSGQLSSYLSSSVSLDEQKKFFIQATEPHGEFVKGMKVVFGKSIKEIRGDFRCQNKEGRFFDAFCQKISSQKLVGEIVELLFDYMKTEKRDKVNKLSEMSDRCIEMSLVAFPGLQSLDKKEIIAGFVDKVSTNQKWKFDSRQKENVVEKILSKTYETGSLSGNFSV